MYISYNNYYVTPTATLSQSLPYLTTNFVGRQQEINELLGLLKYTSDSPRIVSITGAPGFGKSALAVNIGHMLANEDIDVIYINMNEVTGKHALAEKIISISENMPMGTNVTVLNLYQWSKRVKRQILLIFDNCDEQFHTNKDALQSIIKGIVKNSLPKAFKILTTSRQQVAYIEQHRLYIIRELSASHACQLLHGITKSLDSTLCDNISSLTGSVPLALHVVGALLNMPNSPNPMLILQRLEQNLIETLSPLELQTEDRVNASIYLSYGYLETNVQKVGRFLSYFPGSFDESAACQIIADESVARKSLEILVRRSLLDYNKQTNRYIYHRLIREFFKNMSTPIEFEVFNMNYLEHYTTVLDTLAQKHSIEALHDFYIDKHNFKHLFYQFSNVITYKELNKKVVKTYVKLGNTIGDYTSINQILYRGFPSSELQKFVETFLLCLKQVSSDIIKIFSRHTFVELYSKVVIYLLKVEKSLKRDINTLIKYQWIFKKYDQYIPTPQYIEFFSISAEYYEELNDHKMAKLSHEKILLRENVLTECQDECSNLELAKAFIFTQDYKRSMYYCGKVLESLKVLSFKHFVSAMICFLNCTRCFQLQTIIVV